MIGKSHQRPMLERGTEAEAEHRGAPKAHPHATHLHHLLNSMAVLILHLSPCTRLSALTLLPRTGILMPCSLLSLSTLTSVGCSPRARQWGSVLPTSPNGVLTPTSRGSTISKIHPHRSGRTASRVCNMSVVTASK